MKNLFRFKKSYVDSKEFTLMVDKYFTSLREHSISYDSGPFETCVSISVKNSPGSSDNLESNGGSNGGLINMGDFSWKLKKVIHQLRLDNFQIESIIVYYDQYIRPKSGSVGGVKTFSYNITKKVQGIEFINGLGNYGYYLNPDFIVKITIRNYVFDNNIEDVFEELADQFPINRKQITIVQSVWDYMEDNLQLQSPTSWMVFEGKIHVTASKDWNKQFIFQLKNRFHPQIQNFGWEMDLKSSSSSVADIYHVIGFERK